MSKKLIIAVDFDGTIVKHSFPEIGDEMPYAIDVLKALQEDGHKLILWTCRSDIENPTSTSPDVIQKGGNYLTEAVEWCRERGIEFWGVNENPDQKTWSTSPKVYADIYIDDRNLGTTHNIHFFWQQVLNNLFEKMDRDEWISLRPILDKCLYKNNGADEC